MSVPAVLQAEPLLDERFLLGESPAYDMRSNTLSWVDIKTGVLYVLPLNGGEIQRIECGQYLGSAVPTKSGNFLLAMTNGVYLLSDRLCFISKPAELTSNLRLNDAKCDPSGRFLFGTTAMFQNAGEEGSLFCLDTDGTYRRLLSGPEISNGMAWPEDGQCMYYIDSPTHGIDRFDYCPETASISARRRVFTVDEAMPDGMTIDEEGMLWVALWGGGKVIRVDPRTKRVIAEILVPSEHTTSCCFGGQNLDVLYITTSGDGFTDPAAGRVYAVIPGTRGRPEPLFDDSKISFFAFAGANEKISHILLYLEKSYKNPDFSLQGAARDLGISQTKMCGAFKQAMGRSILDYVTEMRLSYIKKTLLETDLPVMKVISSAGYTDIQNGIRRFKQREGLTPGQYRKLTRHEKSCANIKRE